MSTNQAISDKVEQVVTHICQLLDTIPNITMLLKITPITLPYFVLRHTNSKKCFEVGKMAMYKMTAKSFEIVLVPLTGKLCDVCRGILKDIGNNDRLCEICCAEDFNRYCERCAFASCYNCVKKILILSSSDVFECPQCRLQMPLK